MTDLIKGRIPFVPQAAYEQQPLSDEEKKRLHNEKEKKRRAQLPAEAKERRQISKEARELYEQTWGGNDDKKKNR